MKGGGAGGIKNFVSKNLFSLVILGEAFQTKSEETWERVQRRDDPPP